MPAKKKPAYLLHKPTGQARVRIDGRDHYLGPFGSPRSRERYDELMAEWCARSGDLRSYRLTVDDLVLLYLDHAQEHYRKDGRLTSEIHCLRSAFRPLIRLHGKTPVREFGPRALKAVRQQMIGAGHVRQTVNAMISRIRRMFRWGVENEFVPVAVHQSLCAVQGLQAGRSSAVESSPVRPIDEATVEATLKHVSPVVAAMVRLQLLTGARPGEIVVLRPCDVTIGTDGSWIYRPAVHKTAHHGRERRIYLGPGAQAVLRPYLERDPESFCFSPLEARRLQLQLCRTNRRSPMTPSQAARRAKADPRRAPRAKYTVSSYRRAIERACETAFKMPKELRIPRNKANGRSRIEAPDVAAKRQASAAQWREQNVWTPHQLRHSRATLIRRQFGLEAAQVVLGHADCKVTEVYAERNFELAARVMQEIG